MRARRLHVYVADAPLPTAALPLALPTAALPLALAAAALALTLAAAALALAAAALALPTGRMRELRDARRE